MHPGSLWISAFIVLVGLSILAGGIISLLAAVQLSSLISQEKRNARRPDAAD